MALDADEINSYLYQLASNKELSDTILNMLFMGYGFFFRVYDLEDRVLRLRNLKGQRKLHTVFSAEELKRLFKAPKYLKHR